MSEHVEHWHMSQCLMHVGSYWTNEFAMFYSPDTGIDIDGAWIDMNEPSSVSTRPSPRVMPLTHGLVSSAATLARIPLAKLVIKASLPRVHRRHPHRTPPSLLRRPCKSVSTTAETMFRALHTPSRITLVPALFPIGLHTWVERDSVANIPLTHSCRLTPSMRTVSLNMTRTISTEQ